MEKLPFKAGQQAEEKSFAIGYRGAWFRVKIKEITTKKGVLGYIPEYCDYPEEKEQWRKLYGVAAGMGNAKKKSKELMLRPQYPPIYKEEQMPDVSEISDDIVIVGDSWKVGDLVDLLHSDCYWSGRITELFNDRNGQVDLTPKPNGEGSSYKVDFKDLRPSLDWSPKHGWTVPTPEGGADPCARLIKPINQGQETDASRPIGLFSRLSLSSSSVVSNEVERKRKIETIASEVQQDDIEKSASHKRVDGSTRKTNSAEVQQDDIEKSASHERGDSSTRKTNSAVADSNHSAAEQAVEIAKGNLYCRKLKASGEGTLNSKRSDTLESHVMDLEKALNKVKLLKMVLKHGISSPEDHRPKWEFVEPRGASRGQNS